MTPSYQWAFAIAGTVIGVASLIFSILAWRAAGKAETSAKIAETKSGEAAKDARAALRKSDAVEDMRVMSDMATELIGFVEDGKADIAKMKARDLANGAAHVINRRDRFFAEDGKKRLQELSSRVMNVSRTLAIGIPGEPPNREELLDICYEIRNGLTGESAKLLADIERNEE